MSWEVDINMIGQKKRSENMKFFSKYVKIMDRKFQIQKYKVIMGYKYLCEILHGPEVLNLGI